MLGSDLAAFLSESYHIDAIDLDDYAGCAGNYYDILVNANGNSRRFWANQNPLEDFSASTLSVYKSLFDFKFNKYIYISSSDVYPDHTGPSTAREDVEIDSQKLSPYGLHKYLSEEIIRNRCNDYLILRMSMMLGRSLRKGPFYDILHGNELLVTLDSRLQLITTRAVAEVIKKLMSEDVNNEAFNVGGRGVFDFRNVKKYFDVPLRFAPAAETQVYEMDVAKISKLCTLKTSEEYLNDFRNSTKENKV